MDRIPLFRLEDPLAGLDVPVVAARPASSNDLWDAWYFAQVEAELALVAWLEASPGLEPRAHAVYESALDREEQAANDLARRLRDGPL